MGTWARPTENWEKKLANYVLLGAAVDHLVSYKKMIYPIVGDDELFHNEHSQSARCDAITAIIRAAGMGDAFVGAFGRRR